MTVQDSAIAEAHFNQFRVTVTHRSYSGIDVNKLLQVPAKSIGVDRLWEKELVNFPIRW